jgi:hypothetical protein
MTGAVTGRRWHPLAPWLTVAAMAWAVYRAAAQAWVSDDAFISFRYAENFVEGLGLVFNAGERVEGYTNFAWTMLIAAAVRAGADPIAFAQGAGIACYAATIVLLAWTARKAGAALPAAALGLALHEHAQVFATGGLETAMFTLLATALVVAAARAARPGGFALAGFLGVLATMTRPDGALLYAVALALAARRSAAARSWLPLAAAALPGVVLYLPYFAWKWSYYGYPLPNTFYAKSAGSPYPAQGLYYVALYFRCYWILLPGAALLVGLAARAAWARTAAPLAAAALAASALYVAFVAWVGGDFMFARFLVPITPLLLLGFDLFAARLAAPWAAFALTAAVAAGTVARVYPEQVAQPGGARGIVEERKIYTPQLVEYSRLAGGLLHGLLGGQDTRAAVFGGQAMLAYFARVPLAIECSTGLTDPHIAHLPIRERGRVGHEKGIMLDPQYLLRRRVHFSFLTASGFDQLTDQRTIEFGTVSVEGREVPVWGTIITYQADMMRALRGQPGVRFVDFEDYLDRYLQALDGKSAEEVKRDYDAFRVFYFDYNDDPAREQRFKARLGS